MTLGSNEGASAPSPCAVLTELLRLYDWRFELAGREGNPRNETEPGFRAETRRLLNQYGAEKKAAWEAARRVLASRERAEGPPDLKSLLERAEKAERERDEALAAREEADADFRKQVEENGRLQSERDGDVAALQVEIDKLRHGIEVAEYQGALADEKRIAAESALAEARAIADERLTRNATLSAELRAAEHAHEGNWCPEREKLTTAIAEERRKALEEAARLVADGKADPWEHLTDTLKALLMEVAGNRLDDAELRVRQFMVLLAGAPVLMAARIRALASGTAAAPPQDSQILSSCSPDCTTGSEGGVLHSVEHQYRLAGGSIKTCPVCGEERHGGTCVDAALASGNAPEMNQGAAPPRPSFETRAVLAGAYSTLDGHALLTHTAEIGKTGSAVSVLCGRVKVGSLADRNATDPGAPPTCPRCRAVLGLRSGERPAGPPKAVLTLDRSLEEK